MGVEPTEPVLSVVVVLPSGSVPSGSGSGSDVSGSAASSVVSVVDEPSRSVVDVVESGSVPTSLVVGSCADVDVLVSSGMGVEGVVGSSLVTAVGGVDSVAGGSVSGGSVAWVLVEGAAVVAVLGGVVVPLEGLSCESSADTSPVSTTCSSASAGAGTGSSSSVLAAGFEDEDGSGTESSGGVVSLMSETDV